MINLEAEAVLYYPNGSTKTTEQIRRKLAFEEETKVKQLTDFPARRDFDQWTDVVVEQQARRRELLDIPEHIEIEIETRRPILVGLFGDIHAGGEEIDYERFAKDVRLLKEAEGYSITVGDLTDSYFFQPGVDEQILAGEEQVLYMQSALDELAEDDRLLVAIGGGHDLWPKDRMGAHTLYHQFSERYNAHYMEGVSHITLRLNDGEEEVDYKLVGSHQHRGYSVWNPAHASRRQELEAEGCEISFTAHRHEKAYNQQVVGEHGGEERKVHLLSLGTYKKSDRYSRKKGYPRNKEESLGAFGIELSPAKKRIDVSWTIEEGLEKLLGQ